MNMHKRYLDQEQGHTWGEENNGINSVGDNLYEYSTDVSLQWFLLQTLIMVATMVMCIRCVSICIAYRDQQLYNELFAAQAVVQGWPNGERRRRRRRWVGDDPPLSESSVQSLPMINYKSCVKTCSDSSARKCDTLETSSETKSAQSGSVWVYDSCTSCSVCLDEFVEGEVLCQLKPCGHLFHEGCIFPWLVQRSGNCPLCKTAVQPPITRQNSDFGAETPNRQWLDEEETEQDFVSNVLSAMGIIRIPSNEDENNLREPLMDDEQHSLEVDELV